MNTQYRQSVFAILPEELQEYIWGYVVNHREKYHDVMNELITQYMTDLCDNFTCRKSINCNTAIEGEITNITYRYCCNFCKNYDKWLNENYYDKWNVNGIL